MEKEIRSVSGHIRNNSESRTVEGLAVVFNSESVDLGFTEVIAPSAITEDTIMRSDIFAYLDHNDRRGVLARSKKGKGTLKLWLEPDGLHYRFDAPETQLGHELLSYLQRGEIDSSSFAFTVAEDGDKWERRGDKMFRTITKIDKLFDVSPVFQPAYEMTSVGKRKLQDYSTVVEKLNNLSDDIEKW